MNPSSSFREIEFKEIAKLKAGGGGGFGKMGDGNEQELEKYLIRHYQSNGIINYAGYRSTMTIVNKEHSCGEYDRVLAVENGGRIITPPSDEKIYETYVVFQADYEKVRRSESADVNARFMKNLQPTVESANLAKLIAESKSKANCLFMNLLKKFDSYANNRGKELKNDLSKSFSPKLILDENPITLMWFDGEVKLVAGNPVKKQPSYVQRFGDGEIGPLEKEMVYKNIKGTLNLLTGVHLQKYFNTRTRHFPMEFYFNTKSDSLHIMSVHILKELHDFLEELIRQIETYSVIFVDKFKTTVDPRYIQENPTELVRMIRDESRNMFSKDIPHFNEPFNYKKTDFINIVFNELVKECVSLNCVPTLVTVPTRHPTKAIEYFDKKLGVSVSKPGKIEPLKVDFTEEGKHIFLRSFIEQGSLNSDLLFRCQKINPTDKLESIIRYDMADIAKILSTFEKIREYFEIPDLFHEWLPTI